MRRKLSPIAQDNEDARSAGLTYGQYKAPPVLVFVPVLPLAAQVPPAGETSSRAPAIRFWETQEPKRQTETAEPKRQAETVELEQQVDAQAERRCVVCGAALSGRQWMFCGKRCQRVHYYRKYTGQKQQEKPEQYCAVCGKELTGRQRKFCGLHCLNIYHSQQYQERQCEKQAEEQA